MPTSVLVLGAGFGGLELSSRLSEELGDQVDVTLIDRADAFVFGFSKLDVMFGKRAPEAVRLHYGDITTPHVRFRQETITSIDPVRRRVDDRPRHVRGRRPGRGARAPTTTWPRRPVWPRPATSSTRSREPRPSATCSRSFESGTAIVGVCGAPFKCPPAPSEAAMLLDDYLRERGVRDAVQIKVVIPFGTPIPPSPDTSKAILAAFAERGIEFVPDRRVSSLDPATREAVLDDGATLPYDLFLGIPVHRVPAVVEDSRPDRGRLDPGGPANAGHALRRRLRGGRRHERGHAQGRRVRRARRRAWWPIT